MIILVVTYILGRRRRRRCQKAIQDGLYIISTKGQEYRANGQLLRRNRQGRQASGHATVQMSRHVGIRQ